MLASLVMLATGATLSIVLPLPIEAPRGLVEVASFGMTEVTPETGTPIALLHVRMVVTNVADDVPWSFDLTDATVDVDRHAPVHALFVNSDFASLPVASLARGERRTIDFYFPTSAEPAEFNFTWSFKTALRPVKTHARFSREDARPRVADDSPPAGFGESWWLDPASPQQLMYYAFGFAVSHPKNITVTRSLGGRYYHVQSVWW